MPAPEIEELGRLLQIVLNRTPDVPSYKKAKKILISLLKENIQKSGGKIHEFDFKGHQVWCPNPEPHEPHVVDYYYGTYQHFCLGRSGPVGSITLTKGITVPTGYLGIVVEEYIEGSPEKPARVRGFYFYI